MGDTIQRPPKSSENTAKSSSFEKGKACEVVPLAGLSLEPSEAISSHETRQKLQEQLQRLRMEHRILDDQIIEQSKTPFGRLEVQRLKKRKLSLRDQIAKLESALHPDIIA